MKLPNVQLALLRREKIVDCILSPAHRVRDCLFFLKSLEAIRIIEGEK